MARLRLDFDLLTGPFFMSTKGSETPGVPPTTAKVLNIGSSTYPVLSTTSGFLNYFRGKFSHTSGDARVTYTRLELTGSSGGEACRIFTNVNANLDTARGAHISLNFAASAGGSECSGIGTALSCTLHIPNIASWAPTGMYAPIEAQIHSDGTNSDPEGMTELSFFRVINSGGSGKADVDADAVLFSLRGFTTTKQGGNMIQDEGNVFSADNVTSYIKIRINGVIKYLVAVNSYEVD